MFDFSAASLRHLVDARLLFDSDRYANAHYLAGYSLECARKSLCFAGLQSHLQQFDKKIGHEFDAVSEAVIDLVGVLSPYAARYNELATGWASRFKSLVTWNPQERYEDGMNITQQIAKDLVDDADRAFDFSVGLLWLDGFPVIS